MRISPRSWLSRLGIALWRAAGKLPAPWRARLGTLSGTVLYYLHAGRRRIVQVNLARCFPELSAAERRRLARRSVQAFARAFFAVATAWWAPRERVLRLARVRGREHYREALASGRAVIIFAPHFVALDVGFIALSLEGPIMALYRHVKNRHFDAVTHDGRARFGAELIERRRGLTPIVRALRAQLPLYYLPDQDLGRKHSIFVPFFGVQAATVPMLGRLAQTADALVLPCFSLERADRSGYDIVIGPPIEAFPSGDREFDTRRMNEIIESAVRERPEQYFWLHKRFKTRPEGEKKFY